MDKIDQEILTQLLNNPEKPFLKISEELGISPITVTEHYNNMKKEGAFFGPTLMLDLSKIGYQGKAFLHITTADNRNLKTVIQVLLQTPNVFLVSEIVGAFDVLALIIFRDMKEIKELVDRIRAEPSVKKIETSISCDTLYPMTEEYAQIRL